MKKRQNGFTIIELMVVIAMIIVLLSIVFPATKSVLDRARQSGCLANMRGIAQATHMFASENKDHAPGPNWRKGGAKGWLYSNLQMDRQVHLQTSQLYPYLNNYEVYRCPADFWPDEDPSNPDNVPNRPNNSRMITSYCMNGSVIGYGRRAYNSRTGLWHSYYLGEFRASDILYWEPDETKSGGWWWDGANFPWEGITPRHLGWGSAGSVDGSVEKLTYEYYYQLAPRRPVLTRLWNVPGSANGR